MKYRVYTIYDCKSLIYNPPFFQPTDGAATRTFQEVANDSNTSIGRHPRDYSLWYIGDYDDNLGAMLPIAPRVHIVDAMALVQVQEVLPGMAVAPAVQPGDDQVVNLERRR